MNIKNLPWKDKYIFGIPSLDEQHEKIFQKYNEFCDKINTYPQKNESIDAFLEEMTLYADEHFKTEEDLMKKENYPAIQEHLNRHKFFKSVIEEIKENKCFRDTCEILFAIHLAETAAHWLELHISTYDQDMVDFLKERGY